MLWDVLFWLTLISSLAIGFVYFRDLGDVSQLVLKVKRENMIRFIRNEYRLIAIGLGAAGVMAVVHLALGGGSPWAFWIGLVAIVILYGFPWVWVHLGLRNQQGSAEYVSIDEARAYVAPSNQVLVIEKDGVARAHPDAQLMRPHLAGNDEGLAGENVVMTYCAMANLGLGYIPEIGEKPVKMCVLAQHGNNLIVRDENTNEPIQQIYGRPEAAPPGGDGMTPWPTFRMTFRGFQKAYPNGTVFINKPSRNPILLLLDMVTEMVFSASIARHHREAAPVMDNMTRFDDRLPNKAYVWGIDIGEDAACWTDDVIMEHDGHVNAIVGGRPIVLAWDVRFESLGAWYNDTGGPIREIDFFGKSDRGQLARVERLKPGMFWHVWVEFFPHTDINRMDDVQAAAA